MAYKYFIAGSSLLTSPKETFENDFQTRLDTYFDIASDVFIIKEETYFSSGSFQNLTVRINDAIDNFTGIKLSDDFKMLLFRDLDYAVSLGDKFYFDNSYWICINNDKIKSLAASCMVRRCNNVLRWTDSNGNMWSEHCIIDYKIATPDNKSRTDPIVSDGTITIFCQLNDKTNTIQENQRFLFGNPANWMCYRIYGGGLNNFLNNKTTDNESAQLLSLATGKSFVNQDTDDLVNGIADRYKNQFSIIISPSAIYGSVSDSYLLYGVAYLNGNPVDKVISYRSNNTAIATASGSGGSVVNLIATGSCIITGCLVVNTGITDSINVIVSGAVVENDIRITPIPDYILDGDTQIYTAYLYNNGIQQADTFVFEIANNNFPTTSYQLLTIDGNSFSIENKHLYLDYPLVINCTTTGSVVKQASIVLKGAWI